MQPTVEQFNTLTKQVENLTNIIQLMSSSGTFPYDIAIAIQDRLSNVIPTTGISGVTAGSKTQAVDEAGIASYNVAKPMDGFVAIISNGVTYNIPYYL